MNESIDSLNIEKDRLLKELETLKSSLNELETSKDMMDESFYLGKRDGINFNIASVQSKLSNVENKLHALGVEELVQAKEEVSDAHDINYYETIVVESLKEIEHLKAESDSLERAKGSMTDNEYQTELAKINKYVALEQEKLANAQNKINEIHEVEKAKQIEQEQKEIAKKNVYENKLALAKLKNVKARDLLDRIQMEEEISRRKEIIAREEAKLTPEEIASIDEEIKKQEINIAKEEEPKKTSYTGEPIIINPKEEPETKKETPSILGTDGSPIVTESKKEPTGLAIAPSKEIVPVSSQEITPIVDVDSPADADLTEPIEIKSSKKWHINKKKVLIAVGIGVIAVSAIALLNNVAVAALAAQMVKNGALWHTVGSTVEQTALHAANINLAGAISSLTGKAAEFTVANGVWHLGGLELPAFAAKTASFASKIPSIAGLVGGGLLVGSNTLIKSEKYKNYNKKIKELRTALKSGENKNAEITSLYGTVSLDETLSAKEKRILIEKLNNINNYSSLVKEPTNDAVIEPTFEETNNYMDYLDNMLIKAQNGYLDPQDFIEIARKIEKDITIAPDEKEDLIIKLNEINSVLENKESKEESRGI